LAEALKANTTLTHVNFNCECRVLGAILSYLPRLLLVGEAGGFS
jgi:hypothetical protein